MRRIKIMFFFITLLVLRGYSQTDIEFGKLLYNEKEYIRCYNYFNHWMLVDNPEAHLYKAKVLYHFDSEIFHEEAINEINFAIKLKSDSAYFYVVKSEIFNKFGKNDSAMFYVNKAITIDSLELRAYIVRANIWEEFGNNYLCLKDYDKYIELAPEIGNSYISTSDLAIAYFNRGQHKKMQNDIEGACKDWKKSYELGFVGGEIYDCNECKKFIND